VSIVTGYGTKPRSSIPLKNMDFCFAHDVETGSGVLTSDPCSGNRKNERPESKADYLLPSSTEVKYA
jgi:hypothetical protein